MLYKICKIVKTPKIYDTMKNSSRKACTFWHFWEYIAGRRAVSFYSDYTRLKYTFSQFYAQDRAALRM